MLDASVSALIPALSKASCNPSISEILALTASVPPDFPAFTNWSSTPSNFALAKILLMRSVSSWAESVTRPYNEKRSSTDFAVSFVLGLINAPVSSSNSLL